MLFCAFQKKKLLYICNSSISAKCNNINNTGIYQNIPEYPEYLEYWNTCNNNRRGRA